MSGSRTIDKIRKREKWPVKFGDDTVYVRDMLNSEKRAARSIDDAELRGYFMIGMMLLEEDGSRSYVRADGETPVDFATRVMNDMDDVPEAFQLSILETLAKTSAIPESLPKN